LLLGTLGLDLLSPHVVVTALLLQQFLVSPGFVNPTGMENNDLVSTGNC
jgi:hypothetical protein